MLKRLFILLALIVAFGASAADHGGRNTLGVRGGYNTRNESAVAGIYYQYQFSSLFRLTPNIDYIFRHDNIDALGFNLNSHFLFPVGERFRVYPLVGVSVTSWSCHYPDWEQASSEDDVTDRATRWGLNTGAGAEVMCTPTLKLTLEGKMNWVKSYSGGFFTLGIAYVF